MSGRGRPPFNSTLLYKQPSLALRQVIQYADPDATEATVQGEWFWGGTTTQTLAPSLYTNTNTFYGPTISYGLFPARYDNTNQFYGPSISYGLLPSRYDNTNQFYSPTVSYSNTLVPNLLTNTNQFYAPTLTYGLSPARYDNTNTFYSPTITQTGGVQNLFASLYENTNTFYIASLFSEYPDPSQVLAGVQYGPNGTLVGTLTVGSGTAIIRLRSFTEKH